MKVYVFPADTTGCGYYRLIWPALALQRQGYDVSVVTPRQRDQMMQAAIKDGKVVSIRVPSDADVVVLQRVTHRFLAQGVPLIRQNRIAVVIDMDDDLTCIHPANPAFNMLHPRNGNIDHSWENTLRACDSASLVTVSTPALQQRYGRTRPSHVLYNMIPKRMLDVPHTDSNVAGWGGSVHSHPTDLQVMGGAVAQLLQAGYRFKIAGPDAGVHTALGLPKTAPIESTGIIDDIDAWPFAVTSIGVGVAPLADSKFNHAKSWLKMAEYAAVGVPCVASPRTEYARLHKLGVGLLARNPNEWTKKLQLLVRNGELRRELSEEGRLVMKSYTIEENAWRWWEAWSDALSMERESPLFKARAV